MSSGFSIRVGCDLVAVEDVERALERYGDRYLERVFGMRPVTGEASPPARTLAGRFAVKEAVAKAIGVGDRPFPWTDVQIVSDTHGRPRVVLEGVVAGYAREVGLVDWDVSVTHEGNFAMAVLTGIASSGGGPGSMDVLSDVADVRASDGVRDERMSDRMHDVENRVRVAVAEVVGGRIDADRIGESDDLFAAGVTSHQTVQIMLALEDEFDVEFPDTMLTRSTFTSIDSMVRAVGELS